MINHLCIIFIGISLLLLINFQIFQTQTLDNSEEICIKNHFQNISTELLKICYLIDIKNNSILVWFTIGKFLNDLFDSYHFVLRSNDDLLLSNVIIVVLTNFTKLVDFNNSLRIFNLDSGRYKVCVEFQSNSTTFIYQPHDTCIPIQIGTASYKSNKQNPTSLLITLAVNIVVFFILGLVVHWARNRRRKKPQDDDKLRSRSSSLFSTISLRKQRDRFIETFFRRNIDEPQQSRIRQWARNRISRYRISTQDEELEKPRSFREWGKQFFISTGQSSRARSRAETMSHDRISSRASISTTNDIYIISENEYQQISPRITSFNPPTPEEFEMV